MMLTLEYYAVLGMTRRGWLFIEEQMILDKHNAARTVIWKMYPCSYKGRLKNLIHDLLCQVDKHDGIIACPERALVLELLHVFKFKLTI